MINFWSRVRLASCGLGGALLLVCLSSASSHAAAPVKVDQVTYWIKNSSLKAGEFHDVEFDSPYDDPYGRNGTCVRIGSAVTKVVLAETDSLPRIWTREWNGSNPKECGVAPLEKSFKQKIYYSEAMIGKENVIDLADNHDPF